MNSKKHMKKLPTSLKKSCSMKAKRWINFWNISQKRLKSTWSITEGSCSSRCVSEAFSGRKESIKGIRNVCAGFAVDPGLYAA